MKTISIHEFKHTLRDIYTQTENRKFCFILGAGASYKSGIPTGGQLAKKWFDEIRDRCGEEETEKWVKEVEIQKEDLAAYYGVIYHKRFERDKNSGYEFLVQAMRQAKPTFGHIVLAQILTKAPGNCVLTTNFDSLIESSIYQYTDETPLVCGHESLSGYARPSSIHPLIIKVHRDLLLSPKSTPDEISTLDESWKAPLDNIYSNHIPIVIGYGGNDGSLMAYFEKMNKPSNFFWCGHKGSQPSARVEKLINEMDGIYIKIDGFDELMQELLWVFDKIKPIKDELYAITKSRIDGMESQLKEMNIKLTELNSVNTETKKELSAFEYSTMADDEPDIERRNAIYLEALNKFPNTGWLWSAYSYFLHFIKKDYSNLDYYYNEALSRDIENEDGLHANYAIYLHEIKKDYEKAEKHYLKTLSLNPLDTQFNGNYALFLERAKKDYENADKFYLKGLSINPDDHDINASYANFLRNIKKDNDKAEIHYLKVLKINPQNVNIINDYATFLEYIKKNFIEAEKLYLKALSLEPENVDSHANYAVFLNNIGKNNKGSEIHHLKSLSLKPDDANINGNYARFLLIINRVEEAIPFLNEAFKLNNNEKNSLLIELWFYRYAHILYPLDESEKAIETLLNENIKSTDWNLNINIKAVKNHPNPKKLKEFAKRITE